VRKCGSTHTLLLILKSVSSNPPTPYAAIWKKLWLLMARGPWPKLTPLISSCTNALFGCTEAANNEQGWRGGESTRLPPMWPGFDSRSWCHMWVEFVVGSRPCSERFFSGYSGFFLSSKTNISKFQFDPDRVDESHLLDVPQLIPIYLFYLFI